MGWLDTAQEKVGQSWLDNSWANLGPTYFFNFLGVGRTQPRHLG